MDDLDEQVKQFFLNAKRMKVEQRDAEFQRLKQVNMNDNLADCLNNGMCVIFEGIHENARGRGRESESR